MEIYSNTICPVCGATVEQVPCWMHCQQFGALACASHCYGCQYHDTTASIGQCKYRSRILDKRKILDQILDDGEIKNGLS